jgi:hypothetical protein
MCAQPNNSGTFALLVHLTVQFANPNFSLIISKIVRLPEKMIRYKTYVVFSLQLLFKIFFVPKKNMQLAS